MLVLYISEFKAYELIVFVFHWPYLCCNFIISIESGIIGKLVHFPSLTMSYF